MTDHKTAAEKVLAEALAAEARAEKVLTEAKARLRKLSNTAGNDPRLMPAFEQATLDCHLAAIEAQHAGNAVARATTRVKEETAEANYRRECAAWKAQQAAAAGKKTR